MRVALRWLSLLSVLALMTWLFFSTLETRDEIPQDAFLPGTEGDPYLMPGARDATAAVCGKENPCEWAVSSKNATVMMFAEKVQATRAAHRLPDTQQSNWLVVQFSPQLSARERDDLMSSVNGIYSSED